MKDNLKIDPKNVETVNELLTKGNNPVIDNLLKVVEKHGGVDAINNKGREASKLESKLKKLKETNSPYLKDVEWLIEQRDKKAFISMEDYKKKHYTGSDSKAFDDDYAVTLEVSALQFFPWLITEAKKAIKNDELMPGRFIRVRNMKEQEHDNGDTLAVSAAMDIVGASLVETLDTKGTDGANVHLGGPDTITGYFGGPGQPNDYPLKWIDEYIYYYTNFGVKQVLNLNPGTVLLGYALYKLGVDIEFKISVFMGNDNPYSVLWTLMTAKLFSRPDGSTPLIGFNFSNSIDNAHIELCSSIRKELGFEDFVRFEHHITETYKSIVRQPYDRTDELVEVAQKVRNISAKHEGGKSNIEKEREHPSDILDYFMPKVDIEKNNLMEKMELNYLDKHDAVNCTAQALVKAGVPVIAATNLH
jgi:hypothetical protein